MTHEEWTYAGAIDENESLEAELARLRAELDAVKLRADTYRRRASIMAEGRRIRRNDVRRMIEYAKKAMAERDAARQCAAAWKRAAKFYRRFNGFLSYRQRRHALRCAEWEARTMPEEYDE